MKKTQKWHRLFPLIFPWGEVRHTVTLTTSETKQRWFGGAAMCLATGLLTGKKGRKGLVNSQQFLPYAIPDSLHFLEDLC